MSEKDETQVGKLTRRFYICISHFEKRGVCGCMYIVRCILPDLSRVNRYYVRINDFIRRAYTRRTLDSEFLSIRKDNLHAS